MIFRPELAQAILEGRKTVTRRVMSENPRSPWCSGGCTLRRDRAYAVCPGRGKRAVGYVEILDIHGEAFRPALITLRQARAEGFTSRAEFEMTWGALHGDVASVDVWRIRFRLIHPDDYSRWENAHPIDLQTKLMFEARIERICPDCGVEREYRHVWRHLTHLTTEGRAEFVCPVHGPFDEAGAHPDERQVAA